MSAPMKLIASRELRIDQIRLSANNCRTAEPSEEDTAPLEALILAEGLRNPIEVHPMRGQKDRWGAFAGRRRYYALKRLIGRGDLPADYPIPATTYVAFSDAELIEKSLTENFRQDLTVTELFAGIAKAHALGHDVATIARNIGNQDAQLVAGWLRLGTLAKPIFEALAAGEIDVAQAKAYAATEDRALQLEVFEKLRQPPSLRDQPQWHAAPTEIRRGLKVGNPELERRLAFVGADAYRAAGGRYELDLFAEDEGQRGRVVDTNILSELVAARLEEIRTRTRANVARPELRFIPERPGNGIGSTDWTLQYRPKAAEGEPVTLPDDVVAHIAIGDEGEPELTYWWPNASAKHGKARTPTPSRPGRPLSEVYGRPADGSAISTSSMHHSGVDPYEARRAANAVLRNEAGLTADLVEILRSQRRLILRAALIDRARNESCEVGPGVDYLTWAQLRLRLVHGTIATIGAGTLHGTSSDPVVAVDHLRAIPADRIWRDGLRELQEQSFVADPDPVDAFLDYRASGGRTKALAAAVVTGLALERSLGADGYRIAAHDALALELGLASDDAVRRYWTPTADLFAKLPKDQRAAIATPFVEAAVCAGWPRLKDAQLTDNVLQVVTTGHPGTRAAMAEAAARWVHPQLRFGAPPEQGQSPAGADKEEETVA